MSETNIPVTEVVRRITHKQLEELVAAQHVVLMEALALLIGHMHRSRQVDGQALLAHLHAQLNAPEVLAEMPRVAEVAAVLVGRLAWELADPEDPASAAPPPPG
jgi:hypothetical protein